MTSWTCYTTAAFCVACVATVSDVARGTTFIKAGEWLAGGGTLIIVLISCLASWISVWFERCKSRYRLDYSCLKWAYSCLQWWIHCCHPYFQAGPQFILQMNLVWRGVGVEPVKHLLKEDYIWSLEWFGGLLVVLNLIVNFAAITMAFLHDNRERSGSRLLSGLLVIVTGVLLRSFLISMLFAIKPLSAVFTVVIAYIINVMLMKYINREGWTCFIDGYLSIITPTGYARVLGSASGHLSKEPWSTVTDVERVKINQEKLCKNFKISQAKYGTLTAMIFVTYIFNVEFYLLPWLGSAALMPELEDRRCLYITPCVLWLLNVAFASWHLQQMKRARDAARTWHVLTPHKPKPTSRFNPNLSMSFLARETKTVQPPIIRPSAPPPAPPARPSSRGDVQNELLLEPETPKRRSTLGTYKFHQDDCITCDMLTVGSTFKSTMSGKEYKFLPSVSCNDRSVIYLVSIFFFMFFNRPI